jgi:hypothetical protein
MSTQPGVRPARPARPTNGAPGATQTYDPKDAKRARREASLAQRERFEQQERRRRQLIWGGAIIAALLALAALGWWLFGPTNEPKVQSIPIQGQTHIQRGQAHPDYNSVPATSGWHYGDAVAPAGISRDPIPNEVQVHNLEHGEIMVQYDCPQGCPEIVSKLEEIVRSYPKKVILAPYPGLFEHAKQRIALTAWGKVVYLDAVDEAFIRKFVRNYKDKAPEFFPD